ncbi:MAG: hypothetical protein ABEJ65_08095, partial [bacterium]
MSNTWLLLYRSFLPVVVAMLLIGVVCAAPGHAQTILDPSLLINGKKVTVTPFALDVPPDRRLSITSNEPDASLVLLEKEAGQVVRSGTGTVHWFS